MRNQKQNEPSQEDTALHKFITSVINKYIKFGGSLVNDEQYNKRLEVCVGCEFAGKVTLPIPDGDLKLIQMDGCTKCGCPFSTKPRAYKYFSFQKLRIIKASCPVGNWAIIDQQFEN